MGNDRVIQGKMEVAGIMGPLWFMGWLFTIGYAHLGLWQAIWALLLWPYFLGRLLG